MALAYRLRVLPVRATTLGQRLRCGKVEGVDLDLDSWQVTGLQVGLTNEAAHPIVRKS